MSKYATFAIILLVIYYFLVRAAFVAGIHKKGRRVFLIVLYFLSFIYICGQGIFYANTIPDSSPDEMAHISYIYHIQQTHDFIPHFEDMHLFVNEPLKWSENNYEYNPELINYLCHPSLYYQIMRMANGFTEVEPGHVAQIDKMKLRYFSLVISAIGIALLLYIGWSRINKTRPWLHLLYVSAATCIPTMCLEMCGVTNDSLAIVTCCLCVLGLIRFCEGTRNLGTYLLIALGITGSFMNKMTAAMLCVLMALIVLVVTMIKERSFAGSLKKEFWYTLPLYVLPVIYIFIIYQRYGVLQPTLKVIAPTEYFENSFFFTPVEDRPVVSAAAYICTYVNNFFLSWAGMLTDDLSLRKFSTMSVSSLPMELLWLVPVFIFAKPIRENAGKLALPVAAGWISMLLTFALQLKKAYGNWITNGYTGGSQARYYIPFIFCLALGTVFLFDGLHCENGFDPETEITTVRDIPTFRRRTLYNQSIYLLGLIFGMLLFYGNFPFFLMHYHG